MKEKNVLPSCMVDTQHIAHKNLEFSITPTKHQKEVIARHFNLKSVKEFFALVVVKRMANNRIRLKADFRATIEQICVVSLKPFFTEISDSFSVMISQGSEEEIDLKEIDINMRLDEDEEFIEGTKFDAANLVFQYFSLAIDEFPHAPESLFKEEKTQETQENAFSVLKKLNFS